jgi:IclR family transcriptional regulator, acetate operon repressor
LCDDCDNGLHQSSLARPARGNNETTVNMRKPALKKQAPSEVKARSTETAVGTLERGLAILQFFKRVPEASVAEVAAVIELSRSTTYRIAERLRELGFLEVSATTARWRLGRETVQLGVAALQSTDIMRVAPAILAGLLEGTREAVNLAVFDTDSMVLIYREQGPQSVTISSRLGSRRPMHASGLGKAYLAALRASERHAIIERLELTRFTPETIVDKAAFERSLTMIRQRGFADDRREFEQTLACCAAAVFDHRAVPVAAISVSGPADRILAKFDRIGAEVVIAARSISERLGYLEQPHQT